MTPCDSDVYQDHPLCVQFSDLDLSSDVGILLAAQAESRIHICQDIAGCIEEWRDPDKLTHPLPQLVAQRVYQLIGDYEDANDSDSLRHDPIFKIACEHLPIPESNVLASQPTISRLENQVTSVVWVDQGYSGENFERAVRQVCGEKVRIEVIKREIQGFQVLPKRWVVERCFGWLNRYHRLGKDYELYPETSESMIYGCFIRLLTHRSVTLHSV